MEGLQDWAAPPQEASFLSYARDVKSGLLPVVSLCRDAGGSGKAPLFPPAPLLSPDT